MWSTDITYIRLSGGFVCLVAVIDWHSGKVLSWRINNTLDTAFCLDCLEGALQRYGNPEIFNTDQGCQFTSESFTGELKAHGIAISMDGRGRALDNIFVERLWRSVKYEDVYLKGYANPTELMIGMTEYFVPSSRIEMFYNDERPHQSLGSRTPADVYATASEGGARIVDKFSKNEAALCSCVNDRQTSLN